MAFELTPLYAHCKRGLKDREDWPNILERLHQLYDDGTIWIRAKGLNEAFVWDLTEEGSDYWLTLWKICNRAERE